MSSQHAIIGGADEFGEQQHLQLEPHAQRAPAKTKRREAPMRCDVVSSKAIHGTTEQPRVFRFLGEPRVHERPHFRRAAAEFFSVMRDQGSWAATIAEPKLLQRPEKWSEDFLRDCDGRGPIRFDAVLAVPRKVSDPFGVVHTDGGLSGVEVQGETATTCLLVRTSCQIADTLFDQVNDLIRSGSSS